MGEQIVTRNRYLIVGNSFDYTKWLATGEGAVWKYKKFQVYQPNVFSDDGIPVVYGCLQNDVGWKFPDGQGEKLLCLLYEYPTLFTMPYNFEESEKRSIHTLKVLDSPARQAMGFEMHSKNNSVASPMSPLALLFYNGAALSDEIKPGKMFERHARTIGRKWCDSETEAEAYGLAVRLKELEDSGQITAHELAIAKQQHERVNEIRWRKKLNEMQVDRSMERARIMKVMHNRPVDPRYKVEYLIVEPGREFAYRFSLNILNKAEASLDVVNEIKSDFQYLILSDYRETFPNVNWRNLRVVFQDFCVEGGKVFGRVLVLSIDVESLAYDANTRRGVLSVRLMQDQLLDARQWISANLSMLARDKNIAIVTGQTPPPAKYYSLNERVFESSPGLILEVNFKTE